MYTFVLRKQFKDLGRLLWNARRKVVSGLAYRVKQLSNIFVSFILAEKKNYHTVDLPARDNNNILFLYQIWIIMYLNLL